MSSGRPGLPFEPRVQIEGLQSLVRAIRAEEDGKELRKELAKNLRTELKPAAALAKSGIMSMPSRGVGPGHSPGLRSSIARKIRPEVKLGGNWSGARVKAFKTRNVRGFPNAPKRTNRSKGWRHPVFGNTDVWVDQHGMENWFDNAFEGQADKYRQAIQDAMEAMARRIADRATE